MYRLIVRGVRLRECRYATKRHRVLSDRGKGARVNCVQKDRYLFMPERYEEVVVGERPLAKS